MMYKPKFTEKSPNAGFMIRDMVQDIVWWLGLLSIENRTQEQDEEIRRIASNFDSLTGINLIDTFPELKDLEPPDEESK